MKKIFCWFLLLNILSCYTPAFAKHNINVYVEKIEAGYQFKTVLKHYQPYYLTIANNDSQNFYLTSGSEIKYRIESGEIKSVTNDMELYKKSKKNEMGRYFFISLPCTAIGAFVTGASFFILLIPGAAIAVGGFMPYLNAVKYNSKFAKEYYIDNYMPMVFKPGEVTNAYVFIPKEDNATNIIITHIKEKDSKYFDLEIPVY